MSDALHAHPVLSYVGILAALVGYTSAMAGCWLMAYAQSEHARQQIAILRELVTKFYTKDECFARVIGITPQRLSEFFSGNSPLDIGRLWALPAEFRQAWLKAQVLAEGWRLFEADDIALARALYGPKPRAVKMGMSVSSTKEIA